VEGVVMVGSGTTQPDLVLHEVTELASDLGDAERVREVIAARVARLEWGAAMAWDPRAASRMRDRAVAYMWWVQGNTTPDDGGRVGDARRALDGA
jgi:hypothetical protein